MTNNCCIIKIAPEIDQSSHVQNMYISIAVSDIIIIIGRVKRGLVGGYSAVNVNPHEAPMGRPSGF